MLLGRFQRQFHQVAALTGDIAERAERQQQVQTGGAQLGAANRHGVAGQHARLPAARLACHDRFHHPGQEPFARVDPGGHLRVARSHARHHLR